MILSLFFLAIGSFCGTSAETQQRVEELARRPRLHTLAAGDLPPTTRLANEVLYVRADDDTVPFDDPADLEGLTLHFARRDSEAFAMTRMPLAYDDDTGPLVLSFGRASEAEPLTLTQFAFPFGDATHTRLTLSVVRGIHFTERPSIPTRSIEVLEMLTTAAPMISPLVDYAGSPSPRPDVYVKQTSEAVTITFRSQGTSIPDFDLQAILFANGDIRFNYRVVRNIGWGGVVVTTGKRAWLDDRAQLASFTDPAGDGQSIGGGMLDIRAVNVSRIAGTSLLEVRVRVEKPIDRATLPARSSFIVFIAGSLNRVELIVDPGRTAYRVPNSAEMIDTTAARIEGNEVLMYVDEDSLALASRSNVLFELHTGSEVSVDSLRTMLTLGTPASSVETDLDETQSITTVRPLVETYRLGALDVGAVWRRLKEEFSYRDDEIDAVAIYSSFYTDMITRSSGAYATLANPGADGISYYSRRSEPRTPTLMSMNALGRFSGADSTQVLLHEIGHRWLYYFTIMENGELRYALNPLGYHPAQWAHTPAAFPVMTSGDSSCMGGGRFSEAGGGVFRTDAVSGFGYSWHELCLMGLARAEEVQPWFYIRNPDPSLGDEYFPPSSTTVNGTRVDVGVSQIISAMGARNPSSESSAKQFRVLFVVVERAPGAELHDVRAPFEAAFRDATGNRASLITSPSIAPPVAGFTFQTNQFVDQSTNKPLAWSWSFGDGATSSARNPKHAYSRSGTYAVTLTVANAKGSSTITRDVTVEINERRRAVGR